MKAAKAKVRDTRTQKRALENEYERLCFDLETKRQEVEETEDKLGRQRKKHDLNRNNEEPLKPPSSE